MNIDEILTGIESPVFNQIDHDKIANPIVFIVCSKWTNFLNSRSVQSFLVYKQEFYEKKYNKTSQLITLNPDNTFDESLKILSENSIISAPVIGEEQTLEEFKGFIDILDIFVLISYIFQRQKFYKEIEYSITEIFNQSLKSAINFSSLFDSRPIYDNMSLLQALEVLLMPGSPFRGHRLAVFNSKTNKIIGILSQSDILNLARENLHQLTPHSQKTPKELKIMKPVISIPSNTLSKDAFLLLHANRVNGIAIVDPQNGKLIHSLSTSDLKYLSKSEVYLISLPISKYLEYIKNSNLTKKLIIVNSQSKLFDIVNIMCNHRVHRVYINDDDDKPCAVITISDVLSTILNC
ncbi:hypothetical protein DLAC_09345 [Tieghemostelium lacteum]|uniref:CBS domain-containing protein n=1 Tax=Tieghemostelium lacteum TaxID=361077 RepID=A0A151Z9S3_TIELA|nr:hypothetical protein DLAC_09345 [Tieghemostelium lacteum]|eukprot:KYQ90710.1 hypothetical protein DLAC_09345 [Tieghemostelium lacteum]